MSAETIMAMRLVAIRYAAEGIHTYEFAPLDGQPLPAFTAGSHLDLHLPNGLVRQYSLCNSSSERIRYVVGIKRDLHSRGGSRYLHDELRVGAILNIGGPRNNFPLHEDAPHSVLIAGGIGITPLACMAQRLHAIGASWEMHYGVRRRSEAAFLDQISPSALHLHVDEENGGAPLAVGRIVEAAPPGTHLYCCGPTPMLDAFEMAAAGRPARECHVERFTPAQPAAQEGGFTVKLARTGGSVYVAAGQTILEAVRSVGIAVQSSCEQGICGTCETRVISGVPDHRDSLLSSEERAANEVMMICCSGSKEALLVLDL